MQMFSWLPSMADGAKGGQAAPADIMSPRPEESWIDELTVSQLTDNPTGGGEVKHSARSMEQQRSLKEWLEGIKPGYASRFAVAFEAAGVEDSDDLEHMDLREVELSCAATIPRTRRILCLVDLLALTCRTGTKRPRGAA